MEEIRDMNTKFLAVRDLRVQYKLGGDTVYEMCIRDRFWCECSMVQNTR